MIRVQGNRGYHVPSEVFQERAGPTSNHAVPASDVSWEFSRTGPWYADGTLR